MQSIKKVSRLVEIRQNGKQVKVYMNVMFQKELNQF